MLKPKPGAVAISTKIQISTVIILLSYNEAYAGMIIKMYVPLPVVEQRKPVAAFAHLMNSEYHN